jgi:hypothetical protein
MVQKKESSAAPEGKEVPVEVPQGQLLGSSVH